MDKRTGVSVMALVLVFGTLIVGATSGGQESERGRCERACTEQHKACMREANANRDACNAAMKACRDACKNPSPTPTVSPDGSPAPTVAPTVAPSPDMSPSPTPDK
jgi:hypothetical protein